MSTHTAGWFVALVVVMTTVSAAALLLLVLACFVVRRCKRYPRSVFLFRYVIWQLLVEMYRCIYSHFNAYVSPYPVVTCYTGITLPRLDKM